MFKSVLIANRGEISRRIIRTARRMGMRSITVYSDADANAPFVREADEAIAIGPAAARESYLAADKILNAARQSNAEAIHPGYGFLSENADFAQAVIDAGFIWIGPKPHAIRAMGLKDAAKSLMQQAGVPTTPGYLGDDQSDIRLQAEAKKIGFPILIKAVAGGGGKGMRKVEYATDFLTALASCRREAAASFGDDRVLLEIYVNRPRHIEVQIFGDQHGNIVHLFERDCSLQRRHQKVIEEAPAPGMTESVRTAICEAAVKAARAVNYENAGTIEFIADASNGLAADKIWFMEMNTRLQVEHPVTEAVTGLDLVEWQFRVAAGEALPKQQNQISFTGHAIEARLYAENPETGFLPSIGELKHFHLDGAKIRIDSAVEQGGDVTAFYDPMIAKLIAHAPTRGMAVSHLAASCANAEIWPVKTNAAFLVNALRAPDFLTGHIDTGFIERNLQSLTGHSRPSPKILQAAASAIVQNYHTPSATRGFRLNAPAKIEVRLTSDTEIFPVTLQPSQHRKLHSIQNAGQTILFEAGHAFAFTEYSADDPTLGAITEDGAVLSPMPGHILSVIAANGDVVAKNAPLLVMEAMKMEITLTAPLEGVVSGLTVKTGDRVAENVILLHLEAKD